VSEKLCKSILSYVKLLFFCDHNHKHGDDNHNHEKKKKRNDIEFPFFFYWAVWYALGWAFTQGFCIDLVLQKSFV
jgi:hypothetical protein